MHWKDASLLFNYFTSNKLNAWKQEEHVLFNYFISNKLNAWKQNEHALNIIGFDFRAMREKCIENLEVRSFMDKI
jgi:hypothetical protein